MTIEEIILQARTEGVTDDTLREGIQGLINEAVKGVYTKVDTNLAAHGLKKPDGTKTLDYVQSVAQSAKGIDELQKQLDEAKKAIELGKSSAPDIEALQKEHAAAKAKLAEEYDARINSLSSQNLELKLEAGLAGKVAFAEQHKAIMPDIIRLKRNEMMSNYSVDPATLQLKKSDGTYLTDGEGNVQTATGYLISQLEPYQAQSPAKAPNLPSGGSGQNGVGMTFDQKYEAAIKAGINPRTKEGLDQMNAMFPESTDG